MIALSLNFVSRLVSGLLNNSFDFPEFLCKFWPLPIKGKTQARYVDPAVFLNICHSFVKAIPGVTAVYDYIGSKHTHNIKEIGAYFLESQSDSVLSS